MKKTQIHIRIEEKEKEQFEIEAKKSSRSLSNWIIWVVNQFIKK